MQSFDEVAAEAKTNDPPRHVIRQIRRIIDQHIISHPATERSEQGRRIADWMHGAFSFPLMAKNEPEPYDARIQRLVRVLNILPGVSTNSSCEGHEDHSHSGRCPADSFYVDVDIDVLNGGWKSLETIVEAAQADVNVVVTAWADGGLRFDIRGTSGADPDALAARLERTIARPA